MRELAMLNWEPLKPDANGFYHLRVVGTRSGRDANRRQSAIKMLSSGTRLTLVREPRNRYDKNAIAVATADGLILGYIPAARAARLAGGMDSGRTLDVFVTVDGDAEAYLAGLWIKLRERHPTDDARP